MYIIISLVIDQFVSQCKYIVSLERCTFLHNMLYICERKDFLHLQSLLAGAFRLVWNNTVTVLCQGAEVNLGRGEAREFRDIWHPSQAQPGTRRVPWSGIYGTPWRQGAATEQGFIWDTTQRRSTWFQRRQRRAGFFGFRIQGKLLGLPVDKSVFKKCLF